MFLVFIGYTRPGIFHEDGCVSGFFHAVSQRDTALRGKLPGIVDQVIHNLLQTYGIRNHGFSCTFRKIGAQFHPLRHAQPLRVVDLLHDKRKVVGRELKVHCARLDA